jgi:hypothetical protein
VQLSVNGFRIHYCRFGPTLECFVTTLTDRPQTITCRCATRIELARGNIDLQETSVGLDLLLGWRPLRIALG